MPPYEAIKKAREQNLDLVEISPTAQPPVCRIMDYGKYLYQQEKKEREAKKHQKTITVKEVKFRINVDDHDYETKKNHVLRFLDEGDKVKATIFFRGGHQPDVCNTCPGQGPAPAQQRLDICRQRSTILLPHVGGPQLLPREKFLGYKRPKLAGHNHYVQWVNACLGKDRTSAPFDFAGPLTETVLLGVLAARFPGKKLQWNAADLKVANLPEANRYVRSSYRQGWDIKGF